MASDIKKRKRFQFGIAHYFGKPQAATIYREAFDGQQSHCVIFDLHNMYFACFPIYIINISFDRANETATMS